jgi:hypothetical protein
MRLALCALLAIGAMALPPLIDGINRIQDRQAQTALPFSP